MFQLGTVKFSCDGQRTMLKQLSVHDFLPLCATGVFLWQHGLGLRQPIAMPTSTQSTVSMEHGVIQSWILVNKFFTQFLIAHRLCRNIQQAGFMSNSSNGNSFWQKEQCSLEGQQQVYQWSVFCVSQC
jgi:hypothetical protein